MSRLAAAILALLLAWAPPASAHALLRAANPAVGSVVHEAPASLAIEYSEGVEPSFSRVEVHDASGARVDAGTLATAPDSNKRVLVKLKHLPPGEYRVEWHVTSVDTHRTEGSFSFTVAP